MSRMLWTTCIWSALISFLSWVTLKMLTSRSAGSRAHHMNTQASASSGVTMPRFCAARAGRRNGSHVRGLPVDLAMHARGGSPQLVAQGHDRGIVWDNPNLKPTPSSVRNVSGSNSSACVRASPRRSTCNSGRDFSAGMCARSLKTATWRL